MTRNLRLLAPLLLCVGLAACGTTQVSMPYTPTSPPAAVPGARAVVAVGAVTDARPNAEADRNWIGTIRGGYGNPLKALHADEPIDRVIGKAFAAALAVRGLDAGAAIIEGRSHFVFLGAGSLYGIACEGALKLMEMSLNPAQSFHPMEYRHGPVSLIDTGSLVVQLYSAGTAADEAALTAELQAKGARVIGFGGPGDLSIGELADTPAAALRALPALQLLGEKVALSRNIDTETPRHLTKVVVLN